MLFFFPFHHFTYCNIRPFFSWCDTQVLWWQSAFSFFPTILFTQEEGGHKEAWLSRKRLGKEFFDGKASLWIQRGREKIRKGRKTEMGLSSYSPGLVKHQRRDWNLSLWQKKLLSPSPKSHYHIGETFKEQKKKFFTPTSISKKKKESKFLRGGAAYDDKCEAEVRSHAEGEIARSANRKITGKGGRKTP